MKLFRPLLAGLGALALGLSAHAAGGAKHAHAPDEGWPFAKMPAGQLDQESVQRGFQVYKEVCSSCHGMKLLSYRNRGEKGGPFYSDEYKNANDNPLVKAIAAESEILDPIPDDSGDMVYRPAIPADMFRAPYPNDQAAKAANGGALPPDLSVITKARGHGADGQGAGRSRAFHRAWASCGAGEDGRFTQVRARDIATGRRGRQGTARAVPGAAGVDRRLDTRGGRCPDAGRPRSRACSAS
mgnify:CR=1 FL=1